MVVLLILAISIIVLWALYRNDTENFENRGLESFIQGEEMTQEEETTLEEITQEEGVGPSNTETTKALVLGEDTVSNNIGIPVPQVHPTIFIGADTTKPHGMADISPTNTHTPLSGGTNMAKGAKIQHYDPQNVGFAFFNTGFEGTLNVFAPSVEKTIN